MNANNHPIDYVTQQPLSELFAFFSAENRSKLLCVCIMCVDGSMFICYNQYVVRITKCQSSPMSHRDER